MQCASPVSWSTAVLAVCFAQYEKGHAVHECRENNSNTDRRSQVLWPLLPALVHVFANGKAHAQREAAYALANLLACGPGEPSCPMAYMPGPNRQASVKRGVISSLHCASC